MSKLSLSMQLRLVKGPISKLLLLMRSNLLVERPTSGLSCASQRNTNSVGVEDHTSQKRLMTITMQIIKFFFNFVALNWYVNVECKTNQVFYQSFKLELHLLLKPFDQSQISVFSKLGIEYNFLKSLLTIDKYDLLSNKLLYIQYKKIKQQMLLF